MVKRGDATEQSPFDVERAWFVDADFTGQIGGNYESALRKLEEVIRADERKRLSAVSEKEQPNAMSVAHELEELKRDAARWRMARKGSGNTKWIDVWDEENIDQAIREAQ